MLLYIVRHGDPDYSTDSLTQRGKLQAEAVGKRIFEAKVDKIFSSPMGRAKQTAEIINKTTLVSIIKMEEFMERGYGDAEGMTLEERMSKFPDHVYPNQENRLELNKRVIDGIEKINHRYKGKNILLVAHGAVINAILAALSNGKLGSGKTNLTNACISNIYLEQDKWRIKDFNQISHLSKYI